MFCAVVSLCFVVGMVAAAPTTSSAPGVIPLEKQQPTVIPILSQSEETEANGTYKFSYETGNGIKREESSYDKILPKARSAHSGGEESGASGESDEIHVQQGSYSYTAPDGTLISVRYIADENGFQPIGNHIPTVPPAIKISGSNSIEKSGRALKPSDSTSASSDTKLEAAVSPAAASPALLSKTDDVKSSSSGTTTQAASRGTTESAKAESTEAAEQASTTEAIQQNKEVSTASAEAEVTTKSYEDERTTTEVVEVTKEATTTVAPENEVTTKGVEEGESTEATTLPNTTSEAVTHAASSS